MRNPTVLVGVTNCDMHDTVEQVSWTLSNYNTGAKLITVTAPMCECQPGKAITVSVNALVRKN